MPRAFRAVSRQLDDQSLCSMARPKEVVTYDFLNFFFKYGMRPVLLSGSHILKGKPSTSQLATQLMDATDVGRYTPHFAPIR